MDKKLILTYGLSKVQNGILIDAFGEDSVRDITTSFIASITIPAVAVVVNPGNMSDREKNCFSEVFKYDLNTCIVLLSKMPEMLFMYEFEKDENSLSDTIAAIKFRLAVGERYASAKQNEEDTINKIRELMNTDRYSSYQDKVMHIYNTCSPYESINELIEYLPMLDSRSKVPYRVELDSILISLLRAHKLINIEKLEFGDGMNGYDKEWIEFLTENFKNHYEKIRNKNGGRVHR